MQPRPRREQPINRAVTVAASASRSTPRQGGQRPRHHHSSGRRWEAGSTPADPTRTHLPRPNPAEVINSAGVPLHSRQRAGQISPTFVAQAPSDALMCRTATNRPRLLIAPGHLGRRVGGLPRRGGELPTGSEQMVRGRQHCSISSGLMGAVPSGRGRCHGAAGECASTSRL